MADETKKDDDPNGIGDEVSSLVHSIDALKATLPIQAVVVQAVHMAASRVLLDYLTKNCGYDPAKPEVTFDSEHAFEINRLISQCKKAQAATVIVPLNCFIRSGTNAGQSFETVSSSRNGSRC